ncbi:Peroxisomal sarcosine oxidase, partial [Stegodyphus mimosarum]
MDEEIYDLCIIGAGMFGSAAARHASANVSLRVCLVGPNEPTEEERQHREIFSSHYDEGRITRILDDDPACQILSRHSIRRYRELEELSGIHFHYPVGFLYVGTRNSQIMNKMVQVAATCDVPTVDLHRDEIFQMRYPFLKLAENEYALLDDSGAGHISPRKMVAAQKKVAKLQGCHVIHEVVEEVEEMVDGTHMILTETGKQLKAKRVLFCTGAFTNFKKFAVLEELNITVKKETVAFLKIPAREAKRISSMPSIVCRRDLENTGLNLGAYILPPIRYPDGNYYLKIGHMDMVNCDIKTLPEVKQWYLSKGDERAIEIYSKLLIEMLPGLDFEDISSMTCVTCENPSGLPYIDQIRPTVTVAVVGNGKGAKFSDEVGRIAAHLSMTGKWDSELAKSQFKVIFAES